MLVFGVMTLTVVFSHSASAKPFFKCSNGGQLISDNLDYATGDFPGFSCTGEDSQLLTATTATAGYFNAKARCTGADDNVFVQVVGRISIVFCAGPDDVDGSNVSDPGSGNVPPSSFEAPTPATAPPSSTPTGPKGVSVVPRPTGEPSDSADETGGSGSGTEDDIPRGSGFTETDCSDIKNNSDQCGIVNMANAAIKFLSAMVGVVVVAMLIAGGVRYVSAGSDPQAVTKAKEMIRNAIFAIIVFMFLFGFLDWIVPGGLL